jgi:hypothetical protein
MQGRKVHVSPTDIERQQAQRRRLRLRFAGARQHVVGKERRVRDSQHGQKNGLRVHTDKRRKSRDKQRPGSHLQAKVRKKLCDPAELSE